MQGGGWVMHDDAPAEDDTAEEREHGRDALPPAAAGSPAPRVRARAVARSPRGRARAAAAAAAARLLRAPREPAPRAAALLPPRGPSRRRPPIDLMQELGHVPCSASTPRRHHALERRDDDGVRRDYLGDTLGRLPFSE